MVTHIYLKVPSMSSRRRTKIKKVDMSFRGGELVLSRNISRFKCPVPSCTLQKFDNVSDLMNHLRDFCADNRQQDDDDVVSDQDEGYVISDHAMYAFPLVTSVRTQNSSS